MNRRQFFKRLAATAALSAGGIALVEPAKTIFLPPRGGWFVPLRMREVEQYLINTDSLAMRWDVKWMLPNGDIQQAFVEEDSDSTLKYNQMGEQAWRELIEFRRENARTCLANMVPADAKLLLPPLPNGLVRAKYV